MALQKTLSTKPATPYSRPPPLAIKVVATRDQQRVLTWSFEDKDEVCAIVTKRNKTVAISDGHSVSKFTLLEDLSGRVKTNESYVIRGYTLRGHSPPYIINVAKDTLFFRTAPINVPPAVEELARSLLFPFSKATHLRELPYQGFVTVEGKVVEITAIRQVVVGKEVVPLRTVTVEQDGVHACCSMWREAALWQMPVGCQVKVTHMRGSNTTYGYKLQSTNYTELEEATKEIWEKVEVMGSMEVDGEKGLLKVLLSDDRVLEVAQSLWEEQVGRELNMVPYPVNVKIEGGTQIVEINEKEM